MARYLANSPSPQRSGEREISFLPVHADSNKIKLTVTIQRISFMSVNFWRLITKSTTGTRKRCEDLCPDFPDAIYLMPLGIVGSRKVYHSIWLLPPSYPCAGFSSHIPIKKNVYLSGGSYIDNLFFCIKLPNENLPVSFAASYFCITR